MSLPTTPAAKWRPRTLRDALPERATRPEVRAALQGANADVDNPTVTCGCGRRTSADMCLDLRALPTAVRQEFPHAAAFACDGCGQRAMLGGSLTREALALALGAPPEYVTRARLHDLSPLHQEALIEDARRSAGDTPSTPTS